MAVVMDAGKFSASVKALLVKTTDIDKDERYMATSDLQVLLENYDGRVDDSLQTSIRDAIVTELDDKSADVQTIAVSCLSAVVRKFDQAKVLEIGDKLGTKLVDGQLELRDIYSTGIKTLISSLPKEFGNVFGVKLVTILMDGMKKKSGTSEDALQFQMVCVDLLKDLLGRFGSLLPLDKLDLILNQLLVLLKGEKIEMRKRVGATIGVLVPVLPERSFKLLIESLIASIEQTDKSQNSGLLYSYIQTIGVMSRTAGVRMGRFLQQLVPLLARFCDSSALSTMKYDSKQAEMARELTENCLQAFESIIVRCHSDAYPYLDQLNEMALSYVEFDPNYTYTDDEELDQVVDDDGGWDDNVAEFNVDQDDDDSSWKVRRAAVKVLAAFVRGKDDFLQKYYNKLCGAFISRFKERVVSVKVEIMLAFKELLNTAIINSSINLKNIVDIPVLARTESTNRQVFSVPILVEWLPKLFASMLREYNSSSADSKIKSAIISVLQSLFGILSLQLHNFNDSIMKLLLSSIKEKALFFFVLCFLFQDAGVRHDGFIVLNKLFASHRGEDTVTGFVGDLVPCLLVSIKDTYPKIRCEALKLAANLAKCISSKAQIVDIYKTCLDSMLLQDVELETKENALFSVATLISVHGSLPEITNDLPRVLAVMSDRLKNEVSRIAALRSLTMFFNSGSQNWKIVGNVVLSILEDLGGLLRKNSAAIRNEAVPTLISVVTAYEENLETSVLESLVKDCANLLADEDLGLTNLTLQFLNKVLSKMASTIASEIYPKLLILLRSPLIQGDVLHGVTEIFKNLLSSGTLDFEVIIEGLMNASMEDITKSSAVSISQVIASLFMGTSDSKLNKNLLKCLETLKNNSADVKQLRISILTISELGKSFDLSSYKQIDALLFSLLGHSTEEIKTIAAVAMGSVAVGNMKYFCPFLLKHLTSNPDKCYFILSAIKELIILVTGLDGTMGYDEATIKSILSDPLLPILLSLSDHKDEGIRSMVSECLGKVSIVDPSFLPTIYDQLRSNSAFTRGVMVSAIKFALSKKTKFVNSFSQILKSFLAMLKDVDIHVRRQAFLTLNAIFYSFYFLVKNDIVEIFPLILAETLPHPELVREINLGPVTRRIDDGFPLRKAAYQCVDTLLDVAHETPKCDAYIQVIMNGIPDMEADIQSLSYLIMAKLATHHGTRLVELIDPLCAPIQKNIVARLKDYKESEPEKHLDVLRSGVRALYAVRLCPNYELAVDFANFYNRVLQTQLLKDMLAVIEKTV